MIPNVKDVKFLSGGVERNIVKILQGDRVIWSREPDHEYKVIFIDGIGIDSPSGNKIAKTVKVSIGRDLRTCKRFEINQKNSLGTLDYVIISIGAKEYPCKSSRVNGEMKFILEDFKPEYEDRGDYIIWHMKIDVYITKRRGGYPCSIEFDIKIKK